MCAHDKALQYMPMVREVEDGTAPRSPRSVQPPKSGQPG
jgi:hypothetical protein